MFKHITKYLVTFIIAFMSIVPNAMAARFYVEDNSTLRKGCPGQVRVMLDTEGKSVLAADATMTYNGTEMSITNMALGIALPMQTYNVIAGAILELSGARLPATGAFSGNGLYGLLSITPDLGASSINLGFSPDLTVDNVIAEDGTFTNIITAATGHTFNVKDRYNVEVDGVGFCNPDLTPPTVTFILPSNGQGGVPVSQPNEIFSIADNRAGVDISTLKYTIEGVNYTNSTPQTDTSEAGGVYKVETTFTSAWAEGQTVDISVYVCDLNTDPGPNCDTTVGHFNIYQTPPPAPVCGDGIVTYTNGEQCDDGNTSDGDGCSAHCFDEIEPVECPEVPEAEECPAAGLTIIKEVGTEYLPAEAPQVITAPTPEITEEDIIAGTYPEVASPIKESIAGCTRADIAADIIKEFDILDRYNIKDKKCLEDIEHCMLPFLVHSAYKTADPKADRYYPDVYLQGERKEPLLTDDSGPVDSKTKQNIHLVTREAGLQGFYLDVANLSPFRPQWNMTRIQIIKALNWAAFGQQWQYEDEYLAEIGGEQNLMNVRSLAADLTEWWYPRYYNLACDKGIFDCDPLTNFSPDEICSPTWKRDIFARYKVYYEEQKQGAADLTKDSDNDSLVDVDEANIFYTDPDNNDTDNDSLDDADEIFEYKSNPKLADSDYDGLSDGDEVNKYKTSPVDEDTDNDTFTDGEEIRLGFDPLDPADFPVDANGNGIDDDWELKYGISPQNGTDDTDGEGLADILEYRYGTDPTKPDTDGDGFSDADEVFLYQSDPLSFTKINELGVKITNILDDMILTDTRPLIQGFAPAEGMEVEVILRNEFGHEVVLGKAETSINNVWVFTPDFDLLDGNFYLLAKGLDPKNKQILESPLIYVTMDSTLNVEQPTPERLSDINIDEDVLLKDLQIEIRDSHPTLIGRTGFKNKVVATWQSVVGTSAIVADLAGGEFRIQAPTELPWGEHIVSVYAIRESDRAVSKVVTLNFNVKEPLVSMLRGVAFGTEVVFPLWVWTTIFFSIAATFATITIIRKRRGRKLFKK